MSALLLRQDSALRGLLRWLPIAVGIGTLLLGLIVNFLTWLRVGHGFELSPSTNFILFATVMWMSVALFLVSPVSRVRCNRLAMAMPIPPGKLWLTHVVAVLLAGFAILAVMTGLAAVLIHFLLRVTDHQPALPGFGMAGLLVNLTAALILSVVILQLPDRTLHKIPVNRRYVLVIVASLVGGLAIAISLVFVPVAFAIVPLAAALVIGLRAYRHQPLTYTYIPLPTAEVGAHDEHDTAVTAADFDSPWDELGGGLSGQIRLQALVYETIYRGSPKVILLALLGIPLLLLFGITLSGFFDLVSDDDFSWRWGTVFMTIYMLLAFFGKPLARLYLLDPLPVSRRMIFALLTLPSLAVLVFGYGAGHLLANHLAPQGRSDFRMATQCSGIVVPHAFLKIAWDGKAPNIETPWGESHAPWRLPLFKGSRAIVYSPYCTRDSARAEFEALQLSRATEAIYGNAIPESEILQRYFPAADREGKTQLTLQQDYPNLRPQHKAQVFPVLMLLVGASWFLVTAVLLRTYRAGVPERLRKSTFAGFLALFLGLHTVQFILMMAGVAPPVAVTAFWEILCISLAGAVGTPMLWVLSALALGLAYLVAQREFLRSEFPIGQGEACLLL